MNRTRSKQDQTDPKDQGLHCLPFQLHLLGALILHYKTILFYFLK